MRGFGAVAVYVLMLLVVRVSAGRNALVLLTWGKMTPWTTSCIMQARDAHYQGEIVVLMEENISMDVMQWISSSDHLGKTSVREVCSIFKHLIHGLGRPWGENLRNFFRVAILLDPYLRNYDSLLYMDSERINVGLYRDARPRQGVLQHSALSHNFGRAAWKNALPNQPIRVGQPLKSLALIETFDVKRVSPEEWKVFRRNVIPRNKPVTLKFFGLKPKLLKPPLELFQRINALFSEYGVDFFRNDEQVFMALFYPWIDRGSRVCYGCGFHLAEHLGGQSTCTNHLISTLGRRELIHRNFYARFASNILRGLRQALHNETVTGTGNAETVINARIHLAEQCEELQRSFMKTAEAFHPQSSLDDTTKDLIANSCRACQALLDPDVAAFSLPTQKRETIM